MKPQIPPYQNAKFRFKGGVFDDGELTGGPERVTNEWLTCWMQSRGGEVGTVVTVNSPRMEEFMAAAPFASREAMDEAYQRLGGPFDAYCYRVDDRWDGEVEIVLNCSFIGPISKVMGDGVGNA